MILVIHFHYFSRGFHVSLKICFFYMNYSRAYDDYLLGLEPSGTVYRQPIYACYTSCAAYTLRHI
jgi:hypothetical protein